MVEQAKRVQMVRNSIQVDENLLGTYNYTLLIIACMALKTFEIESRMR